MKLIVLDCDGVISRGKARPFDMGLFARLADLNGRARRGEAVPAVTLNTGRPSPYVEAVMQAIDGWQPALYENGAGLYFPGTYQFETTPLLGSEQARDLRELVGRIDRAVVRSGKAYWQPGKTVCYTLYAHAPLSIGDIAGEVGSIVPEVSNRFKVAVAQEALNIYPAGIDKGTGLQWLAEVCGVGSDEMGGVGDTAADIDFLRLVGDSAAPSNAIEAVKAAVDYVSPRPDAAGLHDILDHWSIPYFTDSEQ